MAENLTVECTVPLTSEATHDGDTYAIDLESGIAPALTASSAASTVSAPSSAPSTHCSRTAPRVALSRRSPRSLAKPAVHSTGAIAALSVCRGNILSGLFSGVGVGDWTPGRTSCGMRAVSADERVLCWVREGYVGVHGRG